ncbi:RNA-binding protein S4 [Corynebacterium phocae]|uniref:RNA-binding protein S4 n=1 Tax=Corynebacterium phocae TaxID=161895 RepID=A0A1L7D0T0_9CORY|nr:RNA-binding S4 domain-containing protein [Corynebacterium phocae]APT91642.1 RNA-binding protein S4 [Corynebacterium phocae]KAA8720723.1 RNA-binding S4 domain-containing protein [Corynebacterium phocae]
MLEIAIKGSSIKLGQFLKLASLVATGGEAKEMIAAGVVTVNGETVTARGQAVKVGDKVCVQGTCAQVIGAADGEDDYFDEATANDGFDPEKWRNVKF